MSLLRHRKLPRPRNAASSPGGVTLSRSPALPSQQTRNRSSKLLHQHLRFCFPASVTVGLGSDDFLQFWTFFPATFLNSSHPKLPGAQTLGLYSSPRDFAADPGGRLLGYRGLRGGRDEGGGKAMGGGAPLSWAGCLGSPGEEGAAGGRPAVLASPPTWL